MDAVSALIPQLVLNASLFSISVLILAQFATWRWLAVPSASILPPVSLVMEATILMLEPTSVIPVLIFWDASSVMEAQAALLATQDTI